MRRLCRVATSLPDVLSFRHSWLSLSRPSYVSRLCEIETNHNKICSINKRNPTVLLARCKELDGNGIVAMVLILIM